MKRIIAALCLTSIWLSACTTVHMTSEKAPSPVTQTAVKARDTLLQTSKKLFYVFSKEYWCREDASDSQSAASILLSGLKKNNTSSDNMELYLASISSANDVNSDLKQARIFVDDVTIQARELLDDNPDLLSLRDELKLLEKALISSRQAEVTFTAALEHISPTAMPSSETSLIEYTQSVDALRHVTDAFGARIRGDTDQLEAS